MIIFYGLVGLLLACKDSISVIRSTASILLGRIVDSYPTDFWANDILPELMQRIDTNQQDFVIDGAIYAIKMICEDSPEKLSMDTTRRPIDILVPRLLGLLTYPDPKVRIRAIESMNSMLFLVAPTSSNVSQGGRLASSVSAQASEAILLHMQAFIQGISQLANDPNPGVRRVVCQSIVLLSSMHLPVLEPIYDSVCQFMIQAILDTDDSVSCEACEFWYTMTINVKDRIAPEVAVVKYLEVLIPNLLSRMILTGQSTHQSVSVLLLVKL
jgi:transportin-1